MTHVRRATQLMRARPRLLIAITVLVFGGGGALVAYEGNHPGTAWGFTGVAPPAPIEERIGGLFGKDRCVQAEVAASEARAELDAVGATDWVVVRGPGAEGTTCVGAAIFGDSREVVLLMALDPQTHKGLEAIAEQLLQECRTKDEAVTMVRAVLEAGGEEGWELRTDGSKSYGPSDQIDAIEAHVARGCWIYSGTGWRGDGTRLYWVGGK